MRTWDLSAESRVTEEYDRELPEELDGGLTEEFIETTHRLDLG